MDIKNQIISGECVLGIELGSTRIKAVLIDVENMPIVSGDFAWENKFENGYWTYDLKDVKSGLQASYSSLKKDVSEKYNVKLSKIKSIGISAMMHGYLPFDKDGNLLTAFRTWRNSNTTDAADKLSEIFEFNIPERWSIAHLYHAILNKEDHVKDIDYITTLSGYVHYMLTGKKVLGIGDASGMFPIDAKTKNYNVLMMGKFRNLISEENYNWKIEKILPEILHAGEDAGRLTKEGAEFLDPSGDLEYDIPLCPPEGDAGTGMVATNSIAKNTGNVSAGTSVFAMLVLEDDLKKVHKEIDMVTTPDGLPVAMVHANNCTSEINAWAELFLEFAGLFGMDIDKNELFTKLYQSALKGDTDCSDIISYGYVSGEVITKVENGLSMLLRNPNGKFTISNFMRNHMYSALCVIRIGMDILTKQEKVRIENILGHGGFFKTEKVGQQILADSLNIPVSVMKTAGEGGAWGIALLASYLVNKKDGQELYEYLNENVFDKSDVKTLSPDKKGVEGFEIYLEKYKKYLEVEQIASAK